MSCQTELLEKLDSAISQGNFPDWSLDEDYSITGAMRVSGYTSSSGLGLVFERVDYTVRQGVIECVTFCIGTFETEPGILSGKAVNIEVRNSLGEFSVDFGTVKVPSRGREFDVNFERESLVNDGYLEPEAQVPTPEALLFKICDSLPKEWLFCEQNYLKEIFSMGKDAERLFFFEEWQHLTIEDVFEKEIKPSDSPDIVAMVEALCSGNATPKFIGTPNTSWREQWKNDE
jgi:hypothetical protein